MPLVARVQREAYRRLAGDDSSSRTVDEEAVDKCVNEFLSLEDPELIYNLRVNNEGQPEKYEKFLEVCQTYTNSTVDTATDDRRHDSTSTNDNETTVVTHLATALSVRDLYDAVKEGTRRLSYPFDPVAPLAVLASKEYCCNVKVF